MLFIGVPITSQWSKKGHIYPVQVAQYGLSYFSRWIVSDSIDAEVIKLFDANMWQYDENVDIVKVIKNRLEFNIKSTI